MHRASERAALIRAFNLMGVSKFTLSLILDVSGT